MSATAPLPRVEGRHRNRALAAARRTRAVELRAQGWTYGDIARELGYADKGTVWHIIDDALKGQQQAAVGELRNLEAQRLDALQIAVWEKAMTGDPAAAQTCLRIIAARCRLLGLDAQQLLAEDARPRTVVVPETT